MIAILDYVLLPIIELGESACAGSRNGASRHPESGPRGSSLPRWENRGKYPREPFINSARSFRLFCRRWNVMLKPDFLERFTTQWWWNFTILLPVLFCVCVICLVSFVHLKLKKKQFDFFKVIFVNVAGFTWRLLQFKACIMEKYHK